VHVHIEQERHGDGPAEQLPACGRKQQWQPRQQHDRDDAAALQPQRVVSQVRPAQQLEERAAEDQREVGRRYRAFALIQYS
jgi:hypothetical protein